MSFLFGLYKALALLVWLYLSSALLWRRLVRRWLLFTAAFCVLYMVGAAVFFGQTPVGGGEAPLLPTLIRMLTLLGIAAITGWGFAQEEPWSFDRILGAVLLFVVALTAFVVALHTVLGGKPVELPWWLFPPANR